MDSGQITIEYGKTWTPEHGNGFYIETSSYFSLTYNNTIWFDVYSTCPFTNCSYCIYRVDVDKPVQELTGVGQFTNKLYKRRMNLYNLYEESVFKIGIGNHLYNSSSDDEMTSGSIYRIWIE